MDVVTIKIEIILHHSTRQGKMQTMMLVQNGLRSNGYQLTHRNFDWCPPGRIRIARYETAFDPEKGRGYYGDIYLRGFIRKWKWIAYIKKRRQFEKRMTILCLPNMPSDLVRAIGEFI